MKFDTPDPGVAPDVQLRRAVQQVLDTGKVVYRRYKEGLISMGGHGEPMDATMFGHPCKVIVGTLRQTSILTMRTSDGHTYIFVW